MHRADKKIAPCAARSELALPAHGHPVGLGPSKELWLALRPQRC